MDQLNKTLGDLFKKAPALPKNIKEIIVQYASILNIIGIILTIPAIFGLFSLGAYFSAIRFPGMAYSGFGFSTFIFFAFLVVGLILRIKAIPGLKDKKLDGWNMMYYAALVQAVYSLIKYDFGGLIVGTVISLYFLFQIKEYYKK